LEMLKFAHAEPIKLYVTEGMMPYFKDGPPAEPRYFYAEQGSVEETQKPELLERLKKSVPQCLQKFFKGGRILPNNIPQWLKDAVFIKKRMGSDVDLDVDILKLWNAMHIKAMECLQDAKNSEVVLQGKRLLEDMLEIIPKHALTLYNLSCAESLLGNSKEAVKRLRDAVIAGYRNFEHMMKDEDLENIRSTSEFQELQSELEQYDDYEDIPELETVNTVAESQELHKEQCDDDDIPELVDNFEDVSRTLKIELEQVPSLVPAETFKFPSTPLETPLESESESSDESSESEESSSDSSEESDWTHLEQNLDESAPLLESAVEVTALAESAPIAQPVELEEPVPELWKEDVELLRTMGFEEVLKNVLLLEKHKGDLAAVIEDLLMQ